MCGILKTLDYRRYSMLSHRGTEVDGVEYGRYELVHHRLPIQTEAGDSFSQPIQLDNGFILMFVGEIFGVTGPSSRFTSDVDYLISTFSMIRDEKDMVEDVFLNLIDSWDGFWAIVLEDTHTGITYAFTDPLGKKQLYYNQYGEICSEILPLVWEPENFDAYYRSHVEKFGYSFTGNTPWRGVQQIPPGEVYCFKEQRLMSRFPYKFDWNRRPLTSLRESLRAAVQDRITDTKDNPVAMLVSGGLDSSIIAALSLEVKKDITYYSIENDESEYVRILEKHLGIKVNYLDLPEYGDLEATLRSNEQPVDLGSLLPQHNIMGCIDPKFKVVLTGDGADELFGGYRRASVYDSQMSDILDELMYYHLPRLDRASMRRTLELRSPFLSHDVVRWAMSLPRVQRTNKLILKETFSDLIPPAILNREKKPLKTKSLLDDAAKHKRKIIDTFYGINFF